MKCVAGPIQTSAIVDLSIVSDAYGALGRIRKTIALDLTVDRVAIETYFYLEVDRSDFEALTPLQRNSPVCIDEIANDFRFQYFNLSSFRIGNISLGTYDPAIGVSRPERVHEDIFLKEIQHVINAVITAGMDYAPEKVNEFIRAVAMPQLELSVTTEGGFSGLLKRFDIPVDDICLDDSEPVHSQLLRTAASLTSILALTCYGVVKACGRRRSGHGHCLARKRSTGIHWIFALPLLVATCVLLFAIAHTTDAASMNLYLLSQDKPPIVIQKLKSFSIVATISEFWTADMQTLAMIVFIFSVFLPYFKLLLSLWVFLGPISTRAHGRIVKTLDIVGKWAFLDAFTIMAIISWSSLRVPLQGGVGVAMYVEPQGGFLAFLMGTILCLIIGNILLALHRRAHRAETSVSASPARSCLSFFCCRSRKLSVCVFAVLFLVSFGLIYKGSTSDFCSIQIRGLVGWLMKYMHRIGVLESFGGFGGEMNNAETGASSDGLVAFDFSVVGLGMQMQVVTTGIHPWQTVFCQMTYFIFALAVPLLFCVIGFALSLRVLLVGGQSSWTRRHFLLTVGHTFFSWSAADVYALAAFVVVVEMGLGEIIQETPALSEWIRTTMRPVFEMPGHGNTILSVTSSLHDGARWLVYGALLQFIAGVMFLRIFPWLDQRGHSSADESLEESDDTSVSERHEDYESNSSCSDEESSEEANLLG
eukprot:TRINITY_DN46348_c0_g1_i1.p1 TRINITY_DN46348_c0_g1~~TRINITY_DN46348_c0_g1_i1.p1  ORF type:complete len:776 (+),score=42.69 TRINITY_DN46348_c0_g1_i1:219-2330(+)